jgi:hypothetical protein
MFTRKQYLDSECSHFDYYSQFVGAYVFAELALGISRERLMQSTDPHFNDIPLRQWDQIGVRLLNYRNFTSALKSAQEVPALCAAVCVLKTAARMVTHKAAHNSVRPVDL